MDERGTSGDLSEVFGRCECGAERNMIQAVQLQNVALGHCDGSRPWLGPYTKESCGEPSRLLIRTASNAYFPQLMSVISLPDRDETVKVAVDAAWEFLEEVEDVDQLDTERKKAKVKSALEGLSDEEVFAEVQARRSGFIQEPKSVKQAELETLVAAKDELGNDKPDGNFFARTLPKAKWDKPWMRGIERIVLIHRLREVVAQVGFTRFEAASPDIEGELEMGVCRAALAREITWLPAVENKGEGIFLQFRRDAVETWFKRPDVQQRGRQLKYGFDCWKSEHQGSHREFPGFPYLMLHSFSHLLITAVASMRLSGQLNSGAHLRPTQCRIWHPDIHGSFRCRGDPGGIDRSWPANPRAYQVGPGDGGALLRTIPCAAANTNRKTIMNADFIGSGVPRLFADRGNLM